MNVTRGISTDFGHNKVTVMVEEPDLLLLLAERGAEDPVKARAAMKQRDAFLVMDLEAQALVVLASRTWTPSGSQEEAALVTQYKGLRKDCNDLLDTYVKPPAL
jgi:hypothetical protein